MSDQLSKLSILVALANGTFELLAAWEWLAVGQLFYPSTAPYDYN